MILARPVAPSPSFAGGFFCHVATFAIVLATAAGLSASEPTGPRTDGSATRAANPSGLNKLAESVTDHPVWQLALLERAYQGLANTNPTGALRAPYARKWLVALLKLGLTDEAVSAFESVPASLRDATLEFAGTVRLDRYRSETDSTDGT